METIETGCFKMFIFYLQFQKRKDKQRKKGKNGKREKVQKKNEIPAVGLLVFKEFSLFCPHLMYYFVLDYWFQELFRLRLIDVGTSCV